MEDDLARAEAELRALAGHLHGRDWGSLHDLFSGPLMSPANPHQSALSVEAEISATGLLVDGLQGDTLHRHLLAQVHAKGPWMDHLTSNVLPIGTRNTLIAWPFSPSYTHWLQAGWVSAN